MLLGDGGVALGNLGLEVFDFRLFLGDDLLEACDHAAKLPVALCSFFQFIQLVFDVVQAVFDLLHLGHLGRAALHVGAKDYRTAADLGQFLEDVVHGLGLLGIFFPDGGRAGLQVFIFFHEGVVVLAGYEVGVFTGGHQGDGQHCRKDYFESSHRDPPFSKLMVVFLMPGV